MGFVAFFISTSSGGGTMYYTIKDHQGSLAAVVQNNTVERLNYDPWGRRRNPTDFGYDNVTHTFDRGYTLHEHYDGFDRLVQTNDGIENTRTDYSYNETGVLKGTLDEVRLKVQGGADIQRINYGYDTVARPVQVTEQRATGTYTTTMAYDSQSRVARLAYPNGVVVRYGYLHGYLRSVADDSGHMLWKTKGMDAQGRLLEAELGNGAVTRHTYDTVTHRLQSIVTTKNLQNLTYDYDKFGNLASRKDHKRNLEEIFTYDDMNRLT